MKLLSFCIASIGLCAAAHAGASGTDRYEAEDARLAGGASLKGPSLVQSDIAAQASDMKYVELGTRGAKLEWKVRESGVDGVTLRFTMPDREDGWKQNNPQDGINFCQGTSDTLLEDCSFRGNGDGGWDRRFKYDWRIDLKDGAAASHSIENGGDGRVKVVVTRPRAAYSPRKGSARTVVIRKGVTKLSRPLVLASDEELFLEDGAVLEADAESKDFPVCGRKDSLERPLTWLITTEPGATNVAIRGNGVIDANGTEMFRRGMLVSAVVPHACDGFVMEGVTVVDGNFWTVTPVRSRNVRLRDVAVLNDVDDLRENDAFDVCESSDVVVENCLGVSRDDSFSTKTWSGHRGQVAAKWHGGPLPLERVLFKGCTAWTRCAAFKVGDGVSQPQRDVVFRDSRAFGCRHAVRYSHANGLAETKGVVFENIRIDSWDNRKWPFGWLDIAPAEAGVPGELTLRNIIVRE